MLFMKKQSETALSPFAIFYAYAHEDEILRNELEKHLSLLRRQGLIIEWHDRKILPGTDWQQSIDLRLNSASIILLLITPDFLASDYCYGIEMQRALERQALGTAHVIPIILRPVYWYGAPFAHLQCLPRDAQPVTTWTNRDAAFRDIAQGIHAVIETLRTPAHSPSSRQETVKSAISLQMGEKRCDFLPGSLPVNYVPRTHFLADIREELLRHAPGGTPLEAMKSRSIALHGMGGIGKSVTARALCDDEQVRAAFPDGILWATLGQEPNMPIHLREWIDALGGIVRENVATLESLRATLVAMLENRACLLIIDDVWMRKHAELFRMSGPRCRLLITTRDREIAYELGAHVKPVPAMEAHEAITLLDEWANNALQDISLTLKEQIVSRLMYLPLAVKLAGAQLRRQSPEQWLEDLSEHGVRLLKGRRVEDPHDSLELTFTLSLDMLNARERELYLSLVVFKSDEAVPDTPIKRFWKEVANLNDDETNELIDDLEAWALLEVVERENSTRSVGFHDLLHDFLSVQLGNEGIIEQHRRLLAAYRKMQAGTVWHTIRDDGYLYNHLAYHLQASGTIDELHVLFADQEWMSVRVPQRQYAYDGFLGDLSLAWSIAETAARKQIETGKSPDAFAACVRYALITTSINSIAGNYPAALVAQAIAVGLWEPTRGLSIAAHVPYAAEQSKMFIALLATGKLNSQQYAEAQRKALVAALAIGEERKGEKIRCLLKLIPYLDEEQQAWILTQALKIAFSEDYPGSRAFYLKDLAPYLRGQEQEQALRSILEVTDATHRAKNLMAFVPYLEETERVQVTTVVLETVLTLEYEWNRAEILTALIPWLNASQQQSLLKTVWRFTRFIPRSRLLLELMPHLSARQQKQVVEKILSEVSSSSLDWDRPYGWITDILEKLAPYLTHDQREQIFAQELRATLAMEREDDRIRSLRYLAPFLYGIQQQEALRAILQTKDISGRLKAFLALVPHLEDLERKEALSGLVPEMLAYTGWRGTEILAEFVPHLTGAQQEQVLEQLLNQPLGYWRDESLFWSMVTLASHLSGKQREKVLEKALRLALTVEFEGSTMRARLLAKLAPHLTGSILQQALAAALDIEGGDYLFTQRDDSTQDDGYPYIHRKMERAEKEQLTEWERKRERNQDEALTAQKKQLNALQLEELAKWEVRAVLALKFADDRRWALSKLIPRLHGDARTQALTEMRALKGDATEASLLTNLNEAQRALTLATVSSLQDKVKWAWGLVTLMPRLKQARKQHALAHGLAVTYAIEIDRELARTLAAYLPVAPNSAVLLRDIQAILITQLSQLRTKKREEVLGFLADEQLFALPILSSETFGRIAQDIIEICRLWKWL